MPFVQARGLRFHTHKLGTAGDPPVVMLHGLFTGSLASWWFTAAPAVARQHFVRLLDLRGHGLSDRPLSDYSRSTMRDDVLALTADLAPFALVGHSFGALLALDLARHRPDRVTAVAAVEAPLMDLPGTGSVVDPEEPGSVNAAEAAVLRARDEAPGRVDRADRHPLEETTMIADLAADPPMGDRDLEALPVPALFLFGRTSGYVGAADRVRRVLPDAGCEILDGGHSLHVDARDDVSERLVAFLDEPGDAPGEAAVAYG
ncbi:MAG: alpha/beta fold hydrolase [Actinomycetota bacterium]